jgi:hypothetical protein
MKEALLSLLCLFVHSIPLSAQSEEKQLLLEIRHSLPFTFSNDSACSALLKKFKGVKTTDPLLSGYIGGLYIARSKHAPLASKISAFKTGTSMLETAINEKTNNLELLFLRLTIQLNLPGFLNYNDNIESDKKFVFNNYKSAPPFLKNRIVDFIKTSGHFSESEKTLILE